MEKEHRRGFPRSIFVIVIALFVGLTLFQGGRPTEVPAAKPESARFRLPQFTVLDLDGRKISSQSLLGKVAVLNYWAPWCPPCRREMPTLVKLSNELRSEGVEFIGFAVDSTERSVRGFLTSSDVPFRNALPDRDLGHAVSVLPTTIILDRKGRVAQRVVGEVEEESLRRLLRSLAQE